MATSFSGGESRSTTDHEQATGKLYHLRLRVEWTLFCSLQSWVRTHAVLVIGLYELLDPVIESPSMELSDYNTERIVDHSG